MSAKTRVLGAPPVLDGGQHVGEGVVTYQKNFPFNDEASFEASLAAWLGRYVARASVAPLMQHASGLKEVIDFCLRTTPPLSGWPVTMHLMWDKLSNGQWYVEGVGFSIRAGQRQIASFNASTLREKLVDAAEASAARKGPAHWKAFFGLEHQGHNWLDDAQKGQKLIQAAIEQGHEAVKGAMPTLQNPIGVDFSNFNNLKDGWEIAKAVLGTAASLTRSGGKIAKGWDKIDRADKVVFNLIEKSPGKLAGDVMDVGLPLVFAEAGPVGALGSVILGSFFNIAIASDAARVSKARARLYMYFASGLVGGLAPDALEVPTIGKKRDKAAAMRLYVEIAVYALGEEIARRATPRDQYLMQLALLHYTATHNTTNSWNFGNHVNQNWKHPEDYTLRWSRELMLRSLTWQFSKLKYLTN